MRPPRTRLARPRFSFRDEAIAQGWNADWYALAAALHLQIRVVPEVPDRFVVSALEDVGYDGRDRVIYFQQGGYEPWVAHEIAHFLVATPEERDQINYGFGDERMSSHRDAEAECAAAALTVALWMFRRPLDNAPGRVAPTTADVAADLAAGPLWWTRPALYWCAVIWRYVPWAILEDGYVGLGVRDAQPAFAAVLEPVLRPLGLYVNVQGLHTDPRYRDVVDAKTRRVVVADASLPDLLLHGEFGSRAEVKRAGAVPPVQVKLRNGTVLK